MKNLGYYNGRYDELDKMYIPINDRVCYFGDGIYDVAFSQNYVVYELDTHLDRFYYNAGLLGLNIPLSQSELKQIILKMVAKVDSGELSVYWQATRGTHIREHTFDPTIPANIWIVIKPAFMKDIYKKVKAITVEDTRYKYCHIKTLNLLPNILASQKAKEAGCYESIFYREGKVTECSHSNISILKGGRLITAPEDFFILPGVARANLIKKCQSLSLPVDTKCYTLSELMDADEIIITSSSALCLSVCEIDGVAVGGKDGATLSLLQKELWGDFIKATGSLNS